MDYKSRIGMGSSSAGGGVMPSSGSQTVGGSFGTNFGVQGSATGPALVLTGIVILLVLDYVWTRGQQGGR